MDDKTIKMLLISAGLIPTLKSTLAEREYGKTVDSIASEIRAILDVYDKELQTGRVAK